MMMTTNLTGTRTTTINSSTRRYSCPERNRPRTPPVSPSPIPIPTRQAATTTAAAAPTALLLNDIVLQSKAGASLVPEFRRRAADLRQRHANACPGFVYEETTENMLKEGRVYYAAASTTSSSHGTTNAERTGSTSPTRERDPVRVGVPRNYAQHPPNQEPTAPGVPRFARARGNSHFCTFATLSLVPGRVAVVVAPTVLPLEAHRDAVALLGCQPGNKQGPPLTW
jgi:hypothetical protein